MMVVELELRRLIENMREIKVMIRTIMAIRAIDRRGGRDGGGGGAAASGGWAASSAVGTVVTRAISIC